MNEKWLLEKLRFVSEKFFIIFTSAMFIWALFGNLPVHAEEAGNEIFKHTYTIPGNSGYVQTETYFISESIDYHVFMSGSPTGNNKIGCAFIDPTSNVKLIYSSQITYNSDGHSTDPWVNTQNVVGGNMTTSYLLSNGTKVYWASFTGNGDGSRMEYSGYYSLFESGYDFSTKDGVKDFLEHYYVLKDISSDQEINLPDVSDESYTYTGFSMSGKTASWTGTTQRSHLLDQDVEEYTTFTYGFASSEDQTVSSFIEYDGEYATADKKLKLPWDEMEAKKKDGEFIRQVNITPCYRVPGAFYRGVGAKVYFRKDGSIDKVVMDTKRTDLNTGNMVYDSSLGYLQNVIYTEEKTHDGKGRQATFKWSTQKSLPEDAQVEIVAQNFYIEWFNKKTQENFVYKEYGEDCIYSTGSYSFNANTPVWTWLKEKEIDPFSIKTQSYGTTEYYLRIVTYDETDLKYHYGGWVRVDIKEKTATRVPSTDVETGDFDDIDGLWKQDTTSDDSYHYSTDDEGKLTGNIDVNSWEDLNMNSFTWLFRNLQSMVSSLGEFPNMITSVFGFLPVQFVTALGAFLVAIVLLRFLGR